MNSRNLLNHKLYLAVVAISGFLTVFQQLIVTYLPNPQYSTALIFCLNSVSLSNILDLGISFFTFQRVASGQKPDPATILLYLLLLPAVFILTLLLLSLYPPEIFYSYHSGLLVPAIGFFVAANWPTTYLQSVSNGLNEFIYPHYHKILQALLNISFTALVSLLFPSLSIPWFLSILALVTILFNIFSYLTIYRYAVDQITCAIISKHINILSLFHVSKRFASVSLPLPSNSLPLSILVASSSLIASLIIKTFASYSLNQSNLILFTQIITLLGVYSYMISMLFSHFIQKLLSMRLQSDNALGLLVNSFLRSIFVPLPFFLIACFLIVNISSTLGLPLISSSLSNSNVYLFILSLSLYANCMANLPHALISADAKYGILLRISLPTLIFTLLLIPLIIYLPFPPLISIFLSITFSNSFNLVLYLLNLESSQRLLLIRLAVKSFVFFLITLITAHLLLILYSYSIGIFLITFMLTMTVVSYRLLGLPSLSSFLLDIRIFIA